MDAFIYDAVRTPRGRGSKKGALCDVKPVELLGHLYRALESRNGLASDRVDDVILGCSTQFGPQGANVAKISALYAGWSDRVSGATVNRFCASGLDAIGQAATRIAAGMDETIVAGGVEMLSQVDMFADQGAWFSDPDVAKRTGFVHMGLAADLLATIEGIDRAALDRYAARSHQRASAAVEAGRFDNSMVSVDELSRDELIRPDTTVESLGALPALFEALGKKGADQLLLARYPDLERIEHSHHIGTAPGVADGASMLLLGGSALGEALERRPRARVRSVGHASVDPVVMLSGNPLATNKALASAELSAQDVDLFEVNESFAVVPLSFQRALEVSDDTLNVNGGAISLGHPLGATGGVLVGMLLDELERRDQTIGVASICGGAGVASAVVIERV